MNLLGLAVPDTNTIQLLLQALELCYSRGASTTMHVHGYAHTITCTIPEGIEETAVQWSSAMSAVVSTHVKHMINNTILHNYLHSYISFPPLEVHVYVQSYTGQVCVYTAHTFGYTTLPVGSGDHSVSYPWHVQYMHSDALPV